MNFLPDHSHQNQSEVKKQIPKSILQQLLEGTQQILHPTILEDVGSLRRYYEEKVYLSYSNDSLQYLQHMLHKSHNNTQDYVLGKVRERELDVLADIRQNKYNLREIKEEDKLKKIRDELADKISDIKHSMSNLEGVNFQDQSEETYKKLMEFRQKGYWEKDSEQGVKVKKFLSKMKKQRKKIMQNHEKQLQLMERSIQKKEDRKIRQKEEELKKNIDERIEKIQKSKGQKQRQEQQREKRKEEALALVKKYKSQTPIYKINAEKFKTEVLIPMEQERDRKLAEWKKSKKPIDVEELELHQQWYEQFKEKHNNAATKKEQDMQLEERNMEVLNELFHGKFHQKLGRQRNPLHADYEIRKKQREKIMSYSQQVRQGHKPIQDPKKKEQLSNLINLLQKKRESGRKKMQKEDGQVVFQDISPQQRNMIGVGYLDHLRQFNAGRRKITSQEKTTSMADLTQKPRYQDYLKQQRASSHNTGELKSRSQLRKIISSGGATTRDKYESTMDHLVLLDTEAKRKQTQLRYMRNGKRSMQLKSELDQYYIESAYHNLKMLKQVVQK